MTPQITRITDSVFTREITSGGVFVFVAENYDGIIDVTVAHGDVVVWIFARYDLRDGSQKSAKIIQRHTVPDGQSYALVKSILGNNSNLDIASTIKVIENSNDIISTFTHNTLMIDDSAVVTTQPALEVVPSHVVCRHAATITPVNASQIAYLQSRGLSYKDAENLLVKGFLTDVDIQITHVAQK
jgi:Fe-S cluster assembly scaffold protein SufB